MEIVIKKDVFLIFLMFLNRMLVLKNTPTAFLQRGNTSQANECPEHGNKPSGGEAPVLELRGIGSTFSLPLLPGPL